MTGGTLLIAVFVFLLLKGMLKAALDSTCSDDGFALDGLGKRVPRSCRRTRIEELHAGERFNCAAHHAARMSPKDYALSLSTFTLGKCDQSRRVVATNGFRGTAFAFFSIGVLFTIRELIYRAAASHCRSRYALGLDVLSKVLGKVGYGVGRWFDGTIDDPEDQGW